MNIWWAGFGIGLLGSLHCVGMCGPIALALPFDRSRTTRLFAGNTFYNLGRVVTYTLLGAAAGLIGRGFSLAGLQQPLSIAIGVLLIMGILLPWLGVHISFLAPINRGVGKVKAWLGMFLRRKGIFALFTTGLLNGLLPCGLVYVGLFGAMGTGSSLEGALFMAAFGMGTFSMMFAIGWAGNLISPTIRIKLQKAIPVFVVLLGVIFILRGFGLNIKYLSPSEGALTIEQTESCH